MEKTPKRNDNLSKLLKPYENQWVALSYDRMKVLGAGNTLEEAKGKAEKKAREFVFLRLPPYHVNYVPASV